MKLANLKVNENDFEKSDYQNSTSIFSLSLNLQWFGA